MKKIYCVILCSFLFITQTVFAQSVKELINSGNAVFIEINDINNNTDGAYESFKKHLLGEEWNRWTLVDSKEDANFICRLNIEKKGFSMLSTSYGARVVVITEILTTDNRSVWKSKKQQGNGSVYTAGNALADAMRKVIRRSLTKELYRE